MKSRILSIALLGMFYFTAQAQSFQKEVEHDNAIYHDLNIDVINDGHNNFIVASNIFDTTMSNSVISLKRMDENGNIVWAREYADNSLQNARVFDVANMYDFVVITGSVDVGSTKRTFIAKIEAATGDVSIVKYFDIISPSFNSTGLNIQYTNTDANNNGGLDPGFVVGGFVSNCNSLDYLCSLNMGYVLRVDQYLNVLWTAEVDTMVSSSSDYDFINNITETDNGFFLTGSATGLTSLGLERQAALAYQLDFEGNAVWNSSYIFGNSRDVSVDAYYESGTGNIYMLSNYSSMHNFGITVFDPSGNIINNLSWVINSGDLDRYGFTLKESTTSPNNLVVFGYDRSEYFEDASGDLIEGQSNVFIYEFEKVTGNPVGINYQYLTPHQEVYGEEYNFWNGQMPMIYYPDMATLSIGNSGTNEDYLMVGYRTDDSSQSTLAQITRNGDKRNSCDNLELVLPRTSISVDIIPVDSGLVTTTENLTSFSENSYAFELTNCDGSMGIEDNFNPNTGGLFPNPTNSELTVYLENSTLQSFEIYSVLGQQVKTVNLSGTDSHTTLDVSDLQRGIYFIRVSHNQNQKQTFKFIKN